MDRWVGGRVVAYGHEIERKIKKLLFTVYINM